MMRLSNDHLMGRWDAELENASQCNPCCDSVPFFSHSAVCSLCWNQDTHVLQEVLSDRHQFCSYEMAVHSLPQRTGHYSPEHKEQNSSRAIDLPLFAPVQIVFLPSNSVFSLHSNGGLDKFYLLTVLREVLCSRRQLRKQQSPTDDTSSNLFKRLWLHSS
jgi:hypothetical protein